MYIAGNSIFQLGCQSSRRSFVLSNGWRQPQRCAGSAYSAREINPKGVFYPPQPEKMTGKLLKQVTIPIY
jgi:hypothetical protein